MRVLMVENHALFARTVIEQFMTGHSVDVIGSIEGAKAQVGEHQYDAVLVDYDLDDGKGDALVSWLKSKGWSGLIIAISAKDDGNEALSRAGASAVCSKTKFDTIGRFLG